MRPGEIFDIMISLGEFLADTEEAYESWEKLVKYIKHLEDNQVVSV